jgi:hypothetical protein
MSGFQLATGKRSAACSLHLRIEFSIQKVAAGTPDTPQEERAGTEKRGMGEFKFVCDEKGSTRP